MAQQNTIILGGVEKWECLREKRLSRIPSSKRKSNTFASAHTDGGQKLNHILSTIQKSTIH